MNLSSRFVSAILSLLALPLLLPAQARNPKVAIETEAGHIVIEIFADRAPATAANFLRYVDGGFYDGGRFHRTVKMNNQPQNAVKIEVIQAGVNPSKTEALFPPIELERTNKTGILHKDGVLSMARTEPDSARAEIFICIGDQPELDYGGKRNADGQGFAAFGKVVQGMDVVRRIQQSKAEAQRLTPPVLILKARR